MTRSRLPAVSAIGPVLATFTILGAGPLTIWSAVVFLISVTGAVDMRFGRGTGAWGLLVFTFLGGLAFRRAVAVLRGIPGWGDKRSRVVRAMLLIGVGAIAHLPLTLSTDRSFVPGLSGPLMMILIGGLATALGGAVLTMASRPEPPAPVDRDLAFGTPDEAC